MHLSKNKTMATRQTNKNLKNVVRENPEYVPADVEVHSDNELMDNFL